MGYFGLILVLVATNIFLGVAPYIIRDDLRDLRHEMRRIAAALESLERKARRP